VPRMQARSWRTTAAARSGRNVEVVIGSSGFRVTAQEFWTVTLMIRV
jgi:hypothetical protein